MSEAESPNTILGVAAAGDFLRQLSNVTADSLPEGFPESLSFEETLFRWADIHLPPDQQTPFRRLFSVQALREAYAAGQTSVSFEYDDPKQPALAHRLTLRLLTDDGGDVLCVSSLKELPKVPADPAKEEAFARFPLVRAVLHAYLLFFELDLSQSSIRANAVLRDEDRFVSAIGFPCTCAAFLKRIAARYVRAAWEEEFLARFAPEMLKEAVSQHKKQLSYHFSSDRGTFRMDAFLPAADAPEQICYLGLCQAESGTGNGLSVPGDTDEAVHAAVQDLQMEMQMERDETRRKHRRHSVLLFLITVLIGVAGGSVLDQKIPAFSNAIRQFLPAEATEEPAATPPPVAEEEVPAPETVVTWVPFTKSADFTADIMENGTARANSASDHYESLSCTVAVSQLLDPDWFAQNYARRGIALDGSEAAVLLTLRFEAGQEITSLVPQDAFELFLADAAGNTVPGYQLMDQAMGGAYRAKVEAGTEAPLYKRYDSAADVRYLVLVYYRDAVRHEVWFALRYDDPNVEHETMKLGDQGPAVRAMKEKLALLGYLPDAAKNNPQYNQQTQIAVKAAQEAFGMEATGIADSAFLQRLYREEPPADPS